MVLMEITYSFKSLTLVCVYFENLYLHLLYKYNFYNSNNNNNNK